jgi:hypothetical protein
MALSRPTTFAIGAVTALVLGSGTAYAATGGNLILGRSNSAGATTVLTNGKGTALTLNSKAGTPSLKVSRTTKVPNLNSDLLDGKNGAAFALAAGKTGTILGQGFYVEDEQTGAPLFVAAVATCPPGTRLTGGGGGDFTPDGTLWLSSPAGDGLTWLIASSWAPVVDEGTGLYPDPTQLLEADAQCYNPKGAVPGAVFRGSEDASPAVRAKLAELASSKFGG